jgi:hypothetical protein
MGSQSFLASGKGAQLPDALLKGQQYLAIGGQFFLLGLHQGLGGLFQEALVS